MNADQESNVAFVMDAIHLTENEVDLEDEPLGLMVHGNRWVC